MHLEVRNQPIRSSHTYKIYGAHGFAPYFDTSAFAPVSTARFGTSTFDALRGPGYGNLDLGLFRTFEIRERLKMQFRMEIFNLQP